MLSLRPFSSRGKWQLRWVESGHHFIFSDSRASSMLQSQNTPHRGCRNPSPSGRRWAMIPAYRRTRRTESTQYIQPSRPRFPRTVLNRDHNQARKLEGLPSNTTMYALTVTVHRCNCWQRSALPGQSERKIARDTGDRRGAKKYHYVIHGNLHGWG